MKRALALLLLLSACKPRTQIMMGVVTDVRAPDVLDNVHLTITRDGEVVQDVDWPIPGTRTGQYVLPGSYGVFSEDGSAPRVEVVLTGEKGAVSKPVVVRKSIFSLVSEKTLFLRLGLVAGCVDKLDCPGDQTCIEGRCKPAFIDSRTLPPFEEAMITHVTCDSGTRFISTDTGDPMPMLGSASCVPGGSCEEGTCYLPPPDAQPDMTSPPDMTPDAFLAPLWSQQTTPVSGTLRAVWGSPDGKEVFAVGDGGLILRASSGGPQAAGGWVLDHSDPSAGDLVAVHGFAASDVWAVSRTGKVLHRDGGGWSERALGVAMDEYTAVWGASPGEVWFLGMHGGMPQALGLFLGESRPHFLSGPKLNAIWGSATNDVWAAGLGLNLWHWDGNMWQPRPIPDADPSFRDFRAIWSSGQDVFAVGGDRNGSFILYRFRGDQALPGVGMGPAGGKPLFAVWGRHANDVYAAGEDGVVLHWTGDGIWHRQMTPVTSPLFGLSGALQSGDTYAVGPGGVVLYSTGMSTTPGNDMGTPIQDAAMSIDASNDASSETDLFTPMDDLTPPDGMTPPDDLDQPDMTPPDDGGVPPIDAFDEDAIGGT